ncbi:ABC transporter ATP-binding protein [Clostridium formicaceticum]|uniref:Bacteriocin ABC transporter ATP-binding protein n=1 Tax=Clostridium formicaceticum TaxID=1497 RepID=A0AAC9RKI0_9CLOT|nr:putative bacteriocin export ABC transporter [Clostridium formicaceticum]AOY74555.1 bacteriocin ABC transporter ATP-binding protein [Clostridium formicaceticum]ARE88911.1 Macrolide export ATP-binding/permease protein MacB [Clostridium formicaceticum]
MKIVETINLNKNFGNNNILNDFNLCINEQEIITITGKSGCGKSTLLNIIGLLDECTSGSLFINGKQISKITSKEAVLLRRYHIGYIFQNYALIDRDTVEENLKLALRYSSEKDNKGIIQQALAKVGLENYEKKKIYELSGGEQQRVAIARVFIKPCSVILADEPTGSLDSANKLLVLNLLEQLRQEGKAVIIVTHDLDIAERFDRNIQLESASAM